MKTLVLCLLLGCGYTNQASCAIYAQRDAGSGAMVYSNVPLNSRASGVVSAVVPARVPALQRAGFPVIAKAEQRQRDADRNAILRTELEEEQQRLDRAYAAGAAADVQQRHRSNIAALKREIASVR
jgi:hypothetical protein